MVVLTFGIGIRSISSPYTLLIGTAFLGMAIAVGNVFAKFSQAGFPAAYRIDDGDVLCLDEPARRDRIRDQRSAGYPSWAWLARGSINLGFVIRLGSDRMDHPAPELRKNR